MYDEHSHKSSSSLYYCWRTARWIWSKMGAPTTRETSNTIRKFLCFAFNAGDRLTVFLNTEIWPTGSCSWWAIYRHRQLEPHAQDIAHHTNAVSSHLYSNSVYWSLLSLSSSSSSFLNTQRHHWKIDWCQVKRLQHWIVLHTTTLVTLVTVPGKWLLLEDPYLLLSLVIL